jgi:tetratricopeptide (TPR) repeat protein
MTRAGRAAAEIALRVLSRRVDRAVRRGRLDAALVLARRAAALADRQPDGTAARQWRATLHSTAGWVALQLGDLAAAEAAFSHSLRIEESLDPRSAETALRLSNLAAVAAHRGELDVALDRYARALALGAALDPTSAAYAGDLSSRGVVLARTGRDIEALEHHERASAVLERWCPDSSELAGALTNRATLLLNRGELDDALALFERAFAIETDLDPRSTASATAWSNLGLVHDALGDPDRALDCFRRALEIDRERTPDAPGTAVDHNNIAAVLLATGRPDDAVAHLTEALRIDHLTAPGSAGAAADWHNLGYAHHLAGRLDEAVADYQRALAIDAAIARSSRDVALDLVNLGAAEHQRGRSDDALHLLGQAEEIFDRLGLAADLARCRTNTATVLHDCGQPDAAITTARRACAAAEQARTRAGGAESRELVFALHQSPFGALIAWLAERGADGDVDEAFAVAEAATARSLADLLGARHRGPELPELARSGRVGAAEAMAALPGTLVLRYTEGADRLHLWAGRDGRSVLLPLEIDADRLTELVEHAVAAYRRGGPGGADEPEAQRTLARLLLDPVPDRLWAGARRVLVVPVGSLFRLPFELLPRSAGRLGDAWELAYVPSLSVLLRGIAAPSGVRRAPFAGYVAGDGPVPLPGAATEVRRVAAVLGADAASVRLAPTVETVAATAGTARYLHFATHGVFDDADPLRSGLMCAAGPHDADPVLRAGRIAELSLDADLVVCSACETGLGRLRRGEGVAGLSRAFLLAGARCLVLTLWPVPDGPTRRIMVAFAEQLRAGRDPAAAMHAARSAVRRRHPQVFASPWTWAGFVVVGAGWGPPG